VPVLWEVPSTRGFLKAGLVQPQDLIASDPRDDLLQELKKSTSVNITSDNTAVVQRSQVIIIAVKPGLVENVLKEIGTIYYPGASGGFRCCRGLEFQT